MMLNLSEFGIIKRFCKGLHRTPKQKFNFRFFVQFAKNADTSGDAPRWPTRAQTVLFQRLGRTYLELKWGGGGGE